MTAQVEALRGHRTWCSIWPAAGACSCGGVDVVALVDAWVIAAGVPVDRAQTVAIHTHRTSERVLRGRRGAFTFGGYAPSGPAALLVDSAARARGGVELE